MTDSAEKDAPRCWCGGAVGPREPGDENGLGCLEDIWHIWQCSDLPSEAPMADAPTSVRLCRGYKREVDANGNTAGPLQPDDEYDLPVKYKPDLPWLGWMDNMTYGGEYTPHAFAIYLREWDERVFLHEVLHVLIEPLLRCYHGDDDLHHRIVRTVEVGLSLAGWRFRPDGDFRDGWQAAIDHLIEYGGPENLLVAEDMRTRFTATEEGQPRGGSDA